MDAIIMKKYHSLGNDYLVLDPNKNKLQFSTSYVESLCRRNFGVGADGLLYGPLSDQGLMGLEVYNSDGSQPQSSGSGICVFAKYLLDEGYVKENKISIRTASGEAEVAFLEQPKHSMRVKIGIPSFASDAAVNEGMPLAEAGQESLRFGGGLYDATCLFMGNPNCVLLLEEISRRKAVELGACVEKSPYFPNGTNLQLLKILDRDNIQIESYERGTGYTLSSGTGACAAAAAAHRMGRVGSQVLVHMPGGKLLVEISPDGTVYMTGSAEYVGDIRLADHFFA